MTAAARWSGALADWALPESVLAAAPEDPWGHPVGRFAARADDAVRHPGGRSYDAARDALRAARERHGTSVVVDVGAGSGAAGLPLVATGEAERLVAVDSSAGMLAALRERAAALGASVRTVTGRWPQADTVRAAGGADVVVCHHVLYDVADIVPFVRALSAAAREAVVVEVPPQHPLTWMAPLWRRFHGLARPTRPTVADLAEVLRECGVVDLQVTPWTRDDPFPQDADSRVALVTRRLCLPPDRRPEVAAALADLDGVPAGTDPPQTVRRDVVTITWRPPRTLPP